MNKIIPDSKRSQSNIVVVVLVVLICIIAVILLWNFFNPFVKEKSKDINVEAFKNEFVITEAKLFITGAIRVDVQRKEGDLKVDSLKFVFESEDGKTSVENIEESVPLPLETNKYYFSPIANFGKLKKITVYPVLGGKDGVGSSTDSGNIFNIPSGLVSWWKFEGNLDDFVGKNDGTANGNIQFSDEDRKSVNFISGSVSFGKDFSLNLNKEFAIAFWILSNSKNAEILRKGSTNPNYLISIDDNGKMTFSYSNNGVVNNKKIQKTIGDGVWHQVIITNMAAYVDGNMNSVLNINSNLEVNEEDLILGKDFEGYLDELMIFNKSLDKNQANSIFNSFK